MKQAAGNRHEDGFGGYLKKWKCMGCMEDGHACMAPMHMGR